MSICFSLYTVGCWCIIFHFLHVMTSKFHYQLVFVQHGELLVMSEILCKGKFEGWMDETYFIDKNKIKTYFYLCMCTSEGQKMCMMVSALPD